MGLRGPQPQLKIRSEPLADVTPPDWLGDVARAYWLKHAPQLVENQLLTTQTSDSFAAFCDLHERLMSFRGQPTTRAYLDTHSKYMACAKLWRLVPNEKPNVKEDRYADFGEVEFE
jgi:hypothetical protein